MTISEFHLAVKIKLDKTSSLELPSFEPEEIDFWLNDTIELFIKQRIDGFNTSRTGFEETQKRIDDLRSLVVSYHNLGSANANVYYPNSTCWTLPTNYFRYLGDSVTINTGTTISTVQSSTVTADDLSVKLRDPFSEHNLHHQTANPLRMLRDDELIYISDGNYTITNCYLTYIKKPVKVDISAGTTSDLPESVHQEIVDLTVKRMLENIESPRYATFTNETLAIP